MDASETSMRTGVLLIVLGLLPATASAQTAEQCPPTIRAGDLLDCYNGTPRAPAPVRPARSNAQTSRVTPAARTDHPAASKTVADEKAKYVDMLAEENKRLDARLKVICHGC
jgi:hypothetical protein